MTEFDGRSMAIDFTTGMGLIDKAIASGCDKRLLRWRVSPAQGWSMHMCNISIAYNPSPPVSFIETGAAFDCGMFCGIPFAVDRSLAPDCAQLERLEPTAITKANNLHVPRVFSE